MVKLNIIASTIPLLLQPNAIFGMKTRNLMKDLAESLSYEYQVPEDNFYHYDANTIQLPLYDATTVQSELDIHRAKWNSYVGEGKNYDMTLERSCFCFPTYRGPYSMQVRNGLVQNATYIGHDYSHYYDDDYTTGTDLESLLTVDGVFDQIQNSLDEEYVDIRVEYNETTGHPIAFYSDYRLMIADDEITYYVSDVALVDGEEDLLVTESIY